MASIRREISIDTSVEAAWDALRDWGALHERLAPGFAVEIQLDGSDRIVTFFNGSVLRERLLGVDDGEHRIAWTILDWPYRHHNGAAQVVPDGDNRIRFVWISDLLPDDLAPRTAALMEQGLDVIKQTLERGPRADLAPC
jgi:Polyketide cyclase / dehydrase and lipid transport